MELATVIRSKYKTINNTGAGFHVAICGDIMRMPGLPKYLLANTIDFDDKGQVVGLFYAEKCKASSKHCSTYY